MTDAPFRLAPGDAAPDFTLPDQDGRPVSLRDLRGERVIVYVYPQAMTPACTSQACDFRDNLSSLTAAGYRVLGVSKDEVARLARFRDEEGLTFPLLSDPSLEMHRAYGAFGEKSLYGRPYVGVLRSTFVVDEDGRIAHAFYNTKAKGHVAMLRKRLGLV